MRGPPSPTQQFAATSRHAFITTHSDHFEARSEYISQSALAAFGFQEKAFQPQSRQIKTKAENKHKQFLEKVYLIQQPSKASIPLRRRRASRGTIGTVSNVGCEGVRVPLLGGWPIRYYLHRDVFIPEASLSHVTLN
jgi:hypothetical protein